MANIMWSGFAVDTMLDTDTLVGLRSGANVAFNGNSFTLNAQNLSGLADMPTARINLSSPGIFSHAGNPNGSVAGTLGDFCLNTSAANIIYYCTTAGDAAAAVWKLVSASDAPIIVGGGTSSAIGGDLATSLAPGNFSLSFGNSANTATGINSLAFGTANNATGQWTLCFGNACTTAANYSVAIGNTALAGHTGSVVWGDSNASPAVDSAANQYCLSFAGGYHLSAGSLNVKTAGKGLAVAEGSNAKQGVVTLSAGVGVVANTAVTANSRILYCGQDTNVTGFLKITARSTGSGFTITSSVLSDTGVVAYEIFEPAA
jgi:hypothetical protein